METYQVKWNNHKNTIAEDVSNLLGTRNYADCLLSADGETIKVHRLVLAAASPYLKNLLMQADDKRSIPIIFLNGVSYEDLCKIVEFIYTGKLEIGMNQYVKFLRTASELDILGIKNYQIDTMSTILVKAPPKRAKVGPKVIPQQLIQSSIKTYGRIRHNTIIDYGVKKSHKKKPVNEECRYCSSPYKNISTLRNHERYCLLNPNHATSRCPFCELEVKPGSMTFHKRTKHGYIPNVNA